MAKWASPRGLCAVGASPKVLYVIGRYVIGGRRGGVFGRPRQRHLGLGGPAGWEGANRWNR